MIGARLMYKRTVAKTLIEEIIIIIVKIMIIMKIMNIERISALSAASIRLSTRVTMQGGYLGLNNFFKINA